MKIAIELSEYDGLQADLFVAQQALLTEGMRADRLATALQTICDAGYHEPAECAEIAALALGFPASGGAAE